LSNTEGEASVSRWQALLTTRQISLQMAKRELGSKGSLKTVKALVGIG